MKNVGMLVVLLFFITVFNSCLNTATKHELKSLSNEIISFPTNGNIMIKGQDTVIKDYFNSDYKMVIYTDSLSCSSCSINLFYLWEDLIEYTEQFDGALKYYFIFNPPKSENIRMSLKTSMLDYPMLLDSLGEFERLNPHLPRNKAMHTFLLDEDNNVVLVGNPLNNPEIEKMLKTIVEERLKTPSPK